MSIRPDLEEPANSRSVFISTDDTLALPPESLPIVDAF